MDALKVGQSVWFNPGAKDPARLESDQPMAAVVTYVHADGTVNLAVFGKGGSLGQRAHVPFWDGSGDMPLVSHGEMASDRKRDASLAPRFPIRAADESDEAFSARVAKWTADKDKYAAPKPAPASAKK